ncbi:lectin subunit alpha-like [Stomoxys calcitrans]|uniref:lectin subunit alpha-like n=1 Tax=Stomoxys calcitrans TaxID=35570 RepID=UPI0027E34F02|nr:lectin subunit alpha-like [Stomoxys calcitrans]
MTISILKYLAGIVEYNPPHLWIGLHDNLNTAETLKRPFFSIVDGSQIKFSYWNNGEPNNALYSEHCTHIGMANNFKWNDDKCEKKFGYICEKPQAPVNISCDLNETRKTVYQLNEGLAKDHKNNQEEVQGMLNDNRLQTQSVLQEWQKSSQKSLNESQKSINDIFASKPYLQAVIADVGQPIKQIIREAYNEIAQFSHEAQQAIDGNSVDTQTSIMNKSHAFQQKLEENTNGVDGLLAEHE